MFGKCGTHVYIKSDYKEVRQNDGGQGGHALYDLGGKAPSGVQWADSLAVVPKGLRKFELLTLWKNQI